jgi:hypothetical protein
MTATEQADVARPTARGFRRVIRRTSDFPRVSARRLLPEPDPVWQARRIVATTLGRGHPCLDDVLPLTSEVAKGALRAAGSVAREGELTLTVEATTTWVRVEVREGGSSQMVAPVVRGRADSAGGRVAALLDGFADRWGSSRDERGSAIWFEVRG